MNIGEHVLARSSSLIHNQNRLERKRRRHPDVTLKQSLLHMIDLLYLLDLFPERKTRQAQRDREIKLQVKQRLRQSFPTGVRARDLFPQSDSNSAQSNEQCPFPSISPFHRLEIPRLHKEPKFNTEPLQAQEGPLTNIDMRGTFV